MANKKVALFRKCKTPQAWRRHPVVMPPLARSSRTQSSSMESS